MAKKKSKSKKTVKAEPVKKAQKKKTNTAGWVIGAIIVIVIIIAIILLLRGCAKETAKTTTPTTPTETTKEPAKAEQGMAAAEAPEELKKCPEEFTIGWPKNKLGTEVCLIDGNKVEAQIMYSGRARVGAVQKDSLEGVWFKILTTDGKVKYMKDTRVVKANETLTYTIDVGQKVEEMTAYPMSGDKSCLNHRMLIIKAESCAVG